MSVNSKMTAIADKTRELVGVTEKLGLDAMATNLGTAVNACDSQAELIQQIKTALEGKAAGGWDGHLKITKQSLLSYVTGVGERFFAGNQEIKSVTIEPVSSIGTRAFFSCPNLETVSLMNHMINGRVTIGDSAFDDCINLKKINCVAYDLLLGSSVFKSCVGLEEINIVVQSSTGNLVTFSVPESFCYDCSNLSKFPFERVYSIGRNAFDGCSFSVIKLPHIHEILDYAFYRCSSLYALVLNNTGEVCQISVTAVLGTKIVTEEGVPTGEGFIYVPSALYESYVELIAYQTEQLVGDAATAEYIARAVLRKIEDYPEICG